ncbi:MAG: hypothetical protein NTW33_03240, partial [Methanoregula sp.]|nr:hypothetical protein [Methanoregula sp.]
YALSRPVNLASPEFKNVVMTRVRFDLYSPITEAYAPVFTPAQWASTPTQQASVSWIVPCIAAGAVLVIVRRRG